MWGRLRSHEKIVIPQAQQPTSSSVFSHSLFLDAGSKSKIGADKSPQVVKQICQEQQ